MVRKLQREGYIHSDALARAMRKVRKMFEFVLEFWWSYFWVGFKNSLLLAFVPLGVGFLISLPLTLLDVYGGKIASVPITAYVEFFRGSPLVVQAILFYFTLPPLLDIRLTGIQAALLAFTLNSAAYQKGYIKGAVESVYKDQMMVARSIGMSKLGAIRHVVLPQALRVLIPGWNNEFASMSKGTSAAVTIGVPELTTMSFAVANLIYRHFMVFLFTATLYLVWITMCLKILEMVHERIKIPGFET